VDNECKYGTTVAIEGGVAIVQCAREVAMDGETKDVKNAIE